MKEADCLNSKISPLQILTFALLASSAYARPDHPPPAPTPAYKPAPTPAYKPAPTPAYKPAPTPAYKPAPTPAYHPGEC